ncbi:MAG: hypothetical protein KC493_09310 [Bacteriovoracaceae bacterium]|nr:hypothetical protein [Bacteriovoracaceae bacterium]
MEQRIVSSLGHSLFCTVMTFCSMHLMKFFFDKFENIKVRYTSAIIFPGAIIISLMSVFHFIIDTPDIIGTIIFSTLSGLPYFMLFPLKLISDVKKSILSQQTA